MTLELVPWRGTRVPLLSGEIARYNVAELINRISAYQVMGAPPAPVTTYGTRPAEPISYSFEGFVHGMLYADTPVAAAEAYRLRVFGQAPVLYQEIDDGRPGDYFDDPALDRLRAPWPGGTLGDLMKRTLIYGDFGGNAFILDMDDELVLVRPDWVEIILAKREHRGGQVGWRQVGIVYYEGGVRNSAGVPFLPGEYAHFVPGLPDPLATYRGMSWLTPLIREVQADKSAMDHKVAFFENAASPNLAVSLPKEITPAQFNEFVDLMDAKHKGALNAYKTLYTGAGADVTVIGANMQQMDFSSVQGKGETRIANAAGVPPVLLSFSEGMQGSSLNAGNYVAAKRNFVDTTMRDLWQNFAGSIAQLDYFKPRDSSRVWYDGRDIPFLHEDAKDQADITHTQVLAIEAAMRGGFKPDPAVQAVLYNNLELLVGEHTGLFSVQMQAPQPDGFGGSTDLNGDGLPDGADPFAEPTEPAEDFGALRSEAYDDEGEGGARSRPFDDVERSRGYNPAPGRQVFTREGAALYGLPVGATIPPGLRKLTDDQRAEVAAMPSPVRAKYLAARREGLTHAAARKAAGGSAPPRKSTPAKAVAKKAPAKKTPETRPQRQSRIRAADPADLPNEDLPDAFLYAHGDKDRMAKVQAEIDKRKSASGGKRVGDREQEFGGKDPEADAAVRKLTESGGRYEALSDEEVRAVARGALLGGIAKRANDELKRRGLPEQSWSRDPDAPKAAKKAPPPTGVGASTEGRTVAQLRLIAKAEGIPLPPRGTRSELAQIIQDHRVHGGPESGMSVFATTTGKFGDAPLHPAAPSRVRADTRPSMSDLDYELNKALAEGRISQAEYDRLRGDLPESMSDLDYEKKKGRYSPADVDAILGVTPKQRRRESIDSTFRETFNPATTALAPAQRDALSFLNSRGGSAPHGSVMKSSLDPLVASGYARVDDDGIHLTDAGRKALGGPTAEAPLGAGASLEGRSPDQLRQIAKAEGIPLPSRGTRAELAQVIADHRFHRDQGGGRVFATETGVFGDAPLHPEAPDLSGLTIRQRRSRLRALGFTPEQIDEIAPTAAMQAKKARRSYDFDPDDIERGRGYNPKPGDQVFTPKGAKKYRLPVGSDIPHGRLGPLKRPMKPPTTGRIQPHTPPPPSAPEARTMAEHVKHWHTPADLSDMGDLVDSAASGGKATEMLDHGPGVRAAAVTFADGSEGVNTRYETDDEADSDQLVSALARAIGISAPRVLRVDDDRSVSDVVDGPTWAESDQDPDTPAAQRLGVLDLLAGIDSRDNGSLRIGPDGVVPVASADGFQGVAVTDTDKVDRRTRKLRQLAAALDDAGPEGLGRADMNARVQGLTAAERDELLAELLDTGGYVQVANYPRGPGRTLGRNARFISLRRKPAAPVVSRDPVVPPSESELPFWAPFTTDGEWYENPLTENDTLWLRQQLASVRPQFEHLGRGHWWQFASDRLGILTEHASGDENLFAPRPLSELSTPELFALAAARGLPTTGTREELLRRLYSAGITA